MKMKLVASILGLAVCSGAHAATTIDTTASWGGYSTVNPWGTDDTATYGQTFTTNGVDTVLKSFTFYMGSLDVDYKAYVGTWDGSKAADILWSSPLLNADTGKDGLDVFKITTGNLQLKANTQYVAFFSTSGLQQNYGTNEWGYLGDDVYAGGGFVFFNNGNDFNALTTQAWDGPQWWGQTNDLAFKAALAAPVPEAETYAMLLAGLGLMGTIARRRRLAA